MSITNMDVINFYVDKKEHYPISDDFIKTYQQKTTGKDSYITYALNTGHIICEALSEPNQKWHLLESYYLQDIKEKGIQYLEEKPTCYHISSPELMLWMAEAADIDQEVINIANLTARKEIDVFRKKTPQKAHSKVGSDAIKHEIPKQYNGMSLWNFIENKILDSKEQEG